jgi:hypothetical protein
MGCNFDTGQVGSQIIHWEIIKFLKVKNIVYYELGEQIFSANLYYPVDQKKMTICRFKRRFGGALVPQLTAEYYYSSEYMKTLWNERMEHYLQSLDT